MCLLYYSADFHTSIVIVEKELTRWGAKKWIFRIFTSYAAISKNVNFHTIFLNFYHQQLYFSNLQHICNQKPSSSLLQTLKIWLGGNIFEVVPTNFIKNDHLLQFVLCKWPWFYTNYIPFSLLYFSAHFKSNIATIEAFLAIWRPKMWFFKF